ncbi:melatonin receptor type 1A-like [Paramuricea clavata]|uniref:Melatonin receptor type 1A-like n=1 Tax=Paramuricea clavata TaxID=317549 RepID=A0A7D9LK78_PARCT|nr:melatonin receptor type 1A-like [Paramuricea clavata]
MSAASDNWISRTIFTTFAIAAFLGNGLVLGCYLKKRKRPTLTPFDIYVINLALSDVLAGVFLIFNRFVYLPAMPNSQPNAHLFCTILWGGYILFGLCYVSVYTCVALTIERWLAVVKPHIYRRIKNKNALISLIFVWLWAFFINSTVFISVDENFEKGKCKWVEPNFGEKIFPFLELSFSCVLPFSIIIFLYSHIVWKIRRMENFLKQSKHNYKRRITIIGLAASAALVVGWTPVKVSFMLRYTGVGGKHLQGPIHLAFIMLASSNSFVNPILYGIYSSKFRDEYKEIIGGFFCQIFTRQSSGRREKKSTSKNLIELV